MNQRQPDQPMPPPLPATVAERLGRPIEEHAAALLVRYVDLLLEAGRYLNLTSVREREGIERRHIGESLALLRLAERAGALPAGTPIIDVGSGGGLPGIPFAAVRPDLPVALLEATAKKADFLEQAVAALPLPNVTVLTARAEDAARLPAHRERYGMVTARAVAPLATLAELTLPFARLGGRVLAVKGSRWQEELHNAQHALALCGGVAGPVEPLPDGTGAPLVAVWLHKQRPTPHTYPRRSGLPAHQPLH